MALNSIYASGLFQSKARPESAGGSRRQEGSRPFRDVLNQTSDRLGGAKPSSPQGKQQLQAVKAMAQMEILRLNTVLLRGFGHSSGPDDETGLGEWSGLQGWLQVLGLIQPGQESRESEPDKTAARFPSPSSSGQPLEQSFDAIVEKAAQDNGLDPNLVRAVVKTESNFDHLAVSKAGAMGLMQLMPGTAKDLGVDNPFDPAQNIHGGARYLKRMLDRYSGDLNQALSAYNWGPGNLDRSTGFLPDETLSYIERVNEYYREFSAGRTV